MIFEVPSNPNYSMILWKQTCPLITAVSTNPFLLASRISDKELLTLHWKLLNLKTNGNNSCLPTTPSYIFTSNFFFFLYFGLVCCFIISFFFSLLRQNSSSPFLTAFYNGNHCRKACKTPVAWARGEVLLSVEMC